MIFMANRYYDLNTYFRKIYGCRVQKITIDAGLTCPNRDGTLSTKGCIYCNARGSGTGNYQKGLSVTEQLENGKRNLSKRYKAKKFLAYFVCFLVNLYMCDPLKTLYILSRETFTIHSYYKKPSGMEIAFPFL